ncbi:MAG: hypothetical protein V4592_25840 [Bacteroidota bacterium]
MKTSFKSSALLVVLALLSTGVFAAGKKDKIEPTASSKKDVVLFTAMSQDRGVGVIIHKAIAGKSAVAILDADGNTIMKDVLANNSADILKGYVLTNLDNGKYTIKVTSNKVETKRVVHVYNDDNNQKAFFFEM